MGALDEDGAAVGRVNPVVDGIPREPLASQRRRHDDWRSAGNRDRRKSHIVGFSLVVDNNEGVIDCGGRLCFSEVELEIDDRALPGLQDEVGWSGRLASQCKRNDDLFERCAREFRV